ncbi:MAG TPA: S8 family serine peptidase [Gemmatimonadales bacterium]|nr:S8 family serine peptidase [Gemmatimonadales bacterium]
MRRLVHLAAALALVASTACHDGAVPSDPTGPDLSPDQAQAARGSYIVVFRDGTADVPGLAARLAAAHGAEISHVYQHALRGFAARVPTPALAGLQRHPNVAFVEADQVFSIVATQTGATWGLDRIDQRDLPLNSTYTYNATGSGVRVYIIDTGIRNSHTEFGGRAVSGFTSINDGGGTNDCNGHGTHVAGTVGGTVYGVAKQVSLVAVRVLNCSGSGTTSGVIAGVDWVTANHIKPAVANMSLGGGASSALDQAVSNSIAGGVTYSLSGGNSNASACNYSPARVGPAITVGATTSTDARASYSNFGSCLDLFAPGSSITSAWGTSNTATNTISGTSMAAPHVAGVAALVLQGSPSATPSTVAQAITSNATTGKVTSPGSGSPNRLLYSAFAGSGGGGSNVSPTASFTFSCSGLTCNFNGTGSGDSDGTIVGYAWNFGDGTTGTGVTPSRTYAAGGTYTVALTVTDDGGATGSTSRQVSVSASGGSITLSVTVSKVRGVSSANLSWTGAGGSADVFGNGTKIATVSATTYTDTIGRGGGSRTYQVCNAGTSTCSNSVTVTY